jgi:hypothetical protein
MIMMKVDDRRKMNFIYATEEGAIVRGQLPSSLREKVLYQHVSIYLHAGMFVCLFVCLFVCGFVRPLYYFFQKANNVLYFCCASATQAMLV